VYEIAEGGGSEKINDGTSIYIIGNLQIYIFIKFLEITDFLINFSKLQISTSDTNFRL